MTREHVVIVGGGLAAMRAAERLRERHFDGFVTMVRDEAEPPYNRPPLSKQLLTGTMRESDLRVASYTRLAMAERIGQRATGLDARQRLVQLDTGEALPYDGLVVATGVVARRLPGVPADDRILGLRTIADFRRFDRLVGRARHVAVVGGGFVGCEVAASLRRRKVRVTLVDVAAVLLHHVLGPELGAVLTEVHHDGGVELRLGVHVAQWAPDQQGITLGLSDHTALRVDAVLVAVGTTPAVSWLASSGADLADGVRCDETSHVVGMERVVAAGDVARWPNVRFDDEARRVEHWINAIEHGRAAADALLDGHEHASAFTPVPRFWSEQHGVKIQSVGMPALADRVALAEGHFDRRSFVITYSRGDRLVGALGFNRARSMLEFARLVDDANPSRSVRKIRQAS